MILFPQWTRVEGHATRYIPPIVWGLKKGYLSPERHQHSSQTQHCCRGPEPLMDLYQAETFINKPEVKLITQRTANNIDQPWWGVNITSCINTTQHKSDFPPSKVAVIFEDPQKHTPLSSKQVIFQPNPLVRVLEILRATPKIPYKSTGIQQWRIWRGPEFQGFGYGGTSCSKVLARWVAQ